MLHPAHVGHLGILRALIRDGAARGGFDRALATDSREANVFFSNLKRALTTGYFIEEDPQSGDLKTVAVPGYMYHPDRGGGASQPIGFGLFKAIPEGFELWLTGVDPSWRGHGHGRAMLGALLATPAGSKAYVVRLQRFGRDSPAMAHLLASFNYTQTSNVAALTQWFLRNDAPPELVSRLAAESTPRPGSMH
jgi:GNAT superfamily N-acetyltransferase